MEAISDKFGALLTRMSFSDWGNRQKFDWATGMPVFNFPTQNGYGGHHELDKHNLVHMGGRVYDPTIGRFLSADLLVQEPNNTQSYNRYSYVMNNPTGFVDPSGYCRAGYGAVDNMGWSIAMGQVEAMHQSEITFAKDNILWNQGHDNYTPVKNKRQQEEENAAKNNPPPNTTDKNKSDNEKNKKDDKNGTGTSLTSGDKKDTDKLVIENAGGDTDQIQFELNKLPENVLKTLKESGIKIIAVKDSITEYISRLRGVTPSGWEGSGKTWDSVPGGFFEAEKAVVLATSGKYGTGSVNFMLHEIGHAYDFALGRPSSHSDLFGAAYKVDYPRLPDYFKQSGNTGLREAYAESFARYYSHDPTAPLPSVSSLPSWNTLLTYWSLQR